MRPLEILLILSFLPALVLPFVRPVSRPRWLVYLSVLPLAVSLFQMVLEGYRWQLVPAYALALIVLLVRLPGWLRPGAPVRRRWMGLIGSVLSLPVMAGAVAAAVLIPVFQLPEPTGNYAVGTTARQFHDDSRNRDLMVQVWYPAGDTSQAVTAPYIPQSEELMPALMDAIGFPRFLLDHLRYVQSHSLTDAPVAGDQPAYPVILFSPGMGSYRFQNVTQMEELASHGYMVVALDHTDYGVTVLNDGTVKPFTATEEMKFANQITAAPVMQVEWEADQRFVLDQVESLNQSDPLLSGRFDLAHLGAFGHSFGGATITVFCEHDSRCLASANLDGSMVLADDQPAWKKPFWYFLSDYPFMTPTMPTPEQLKNMGISQEVYVNTVTRLLDDYHRAYDLRGDQGMWLHITGTMHQNYSDMELIAPVYAVIGFNGKIDPVRNTTIMNAYLLAFFDMYLKGEPSPLAAGESPDYPEVSIVAGDEIPAEIVAQS